MTSHSDILYDFNGMMADRLGSCGVQRDEIESLRPAMQRIFDGMTDLRRLGQLPYRDLPFHEELAAKVYQRAEKVKGRFETILLLGIGGSSLGAEFLFQSLGSSCDMDLKVCDTVDPSEWRRLEDELDFKKTLLLVISKSGKTIETLAAFLHFEDLFKKRIGIRHKDHLFFVTDPRDGALRKLMAEEGIDGLEIPPGVGGRFSVLTAAGLFPASCAGVNISELLAGARRMDQHCAKTDPWFNPAMMSALLHYLFDRQRRHRIRVVMPYASRLEKFGGWFAQLWAESLGKRHSLRGKEVFSGTTPVSALGPRDQHSQLQLYVDGPRDKAVTFLAVENGAEKAPLSDRLWPLAGLAPVRGSTAHDLLRAEMKATEQALVESGCPNQTILLPEVSPHAIGQLIYMAEVETVFAGHLYNVNPFDQPAVERIKRKIGPCLSEKDEKRDRSYLI